MLLAGVAVENTALTFDKAFDYAVPQEFEESAKPGCRVTVPFGTSSKKRLGIIMSVHNGEAPARVKKLGEVLDTEPLLSDEMLRLAVWLKERTFCTLYEACRAMLPTGINHRMVLSYTVSGENNEAAAALTGSEKEVYEYLASKSGYVKRDVLLKNLGLTSDSSIPDNLVKKGLLFRNSDAVRNVGDAAVRMLTLNGEEACSKLTAKQKLVYDVLKDCGCATVKELCYFTGVTPAVPASLVKKDIARYVEFEVLRTPDYDRAQQDTHEIVLTDEQQKAFNSIAQKIDGRKPSVTLLYGVTGSGKTSVYLKAIDKVIAEGKSVIIMVPEIALTPQTLSIFRRRYGEQVAVFHSALSAGERVDEFKRVKRGNAKIIVGTRSAVFAPVSDPGLIIIDEEQEHTYKSEQSPRYNTVDVAKFRAAYHSCPLVLASATPSVESFANALSGRYSLETLTQRYGDAVLPEVITVDMLKEPVSPGCNALSMKLIDELKANLEAGRQSILLINRRGYNTFVACGSCGHVITCPYCSISMTYHAANKRLMCHYCGYSTPFMTDCPECGEPAVRYAGFGTQKIEDELKRLLPEARIVRMDTDTTSGRDSHEKMLGDFSDGKYDIMIGTQMVAKGLDFPNVTLVGVISVDSQLYNDDFRSLEKTFSLLTQVVGRSGRGSAAGRAIIQTMNPENEIIRLAATQDYKAFFDTEIKMRRALVYPPYCDICVAAFTGESEVAVRNAANSFFASLKQKYASEYKNEKMVVLGPGPARVSKLSSKFRYRLIIKCINSAEFRKMINELIVEYSKMREFSTVTAHIEMNPDSIM